MSSKNKSKHSGIQPNSRPANQQGSGGNSNKTANNSGSNSKPPKKKGGYVRRSPNAKQPGFTTNGLQPVFAAYLNMARANLYNVLCYISAQCGEKADCDEENMRNLRVVRFAEKIKYPEQQEKIFRLLMRHLPILQYMSQSVITQDKPGRDGKAAVEKHIQVDYKDLQGILEDVIGVVSYKRNKLTHANHYDSAEAAAEELERERHLFASLNKAFIGSKREAKRVYKFTKADMDFVDQDERMGQLKDENGKTLKDESGKPRYVEHPDWFFRLYDVEEVEDGKKEFRLTAAGLTFLLCKLLHKKYASQLAQKTGLFRSPDQKGFSPFNKKENEVMFDIFCMRRIRLPRGRVVSTADSLALGMDMLNELQKCPSELFESFGPKAKKLFQVERKDGKTVPDPDDDINLFRRNGDRFPYLALRYIDAMRNDEKPENRVLKDIVFQLSLGKFRYKFYNRPSLDKPFLPPDVSDRVRVLQKEINGFGPIDKVEELRTSNKFYGGIIRPVSDDPDQLYDPDTADTKPYLTDHHAAYAITGNRIGLMWNDVDNEGAPLDKDTLCFLPKLPATAEEIKLKDIENNLVPRAWLSIYDLPALMFLHLIGGDPEDVIKSAFKKLRKLLKAIHNGDLVPQGGDWEQALKRYGVKPADVPDKIIEYLKSKPLDEGGDAKAYEAASKSAADKAFMKWVDEQLSGNPAEKKQGMIESLKKRKERFEENLKMVGGKMNRVGRKGYVEVRPGALARYLAKDIMRFTSPDPSRPPKNGKPSGMDFGVLTAAIASFKSDGKPLADTELGKMLKKAINIANHPFINNIFAKQPKDTIGLYLAYQEAKIKFLEKLKNGRNYKDQWFLREAYRNRVAKIPSYMQGDEGLANRYLDTLQLPDGLFDNAIRRQLKSLNIAKINDAVDAEGNGVSHLINVYFSEVLHDAPQPFYQSGDGRYKRHYKVLDSLFYAPQDGVDPLRNTAATDWPEIFFSDIDIASKLRKGNAKKSPIIVALDNHINTLQMIVGSHKEMVYDKKKHAYVEKKESDYGPAKKQIKEDERTKLMHQLRDMQRNERTIRRYRNEDMLMFMMAKRILFAGDAGFAKRSSISGGVDSFHLRDIMPPGCENEKSILNQTVDLSVSIVLVNEKNKEIKDERGQKIRRTIRQEGIKLKNFGDFYTFLYDSRIGSLLKQMQEGRVIDRNCLEEELDHYDRQRHQVFEIIQAIERRIIELHPEVKNPHSDKFNYAERNMPYLNSFSGLLSLCKEYLKENGDPNDVSKLLVEIRNAYSHNRYVESSLTELDITKMLPPQVATRIMEWLKKQKNTSVNE